MDTDIINRMRHEEADLARKLEAVRAVLRAYGQTIPDSFAITDKADAEVRKPRAYQANSPTRAREKLPLERFSAYGQKVVKAAIEECFSHLGSPISSRDMVILIEQRGIAVQGNDKANAISALLARSMDLKPNGRKGWTLSEEYLAQHSQKENEPQDFDEILGGSDLAHHAPKEEITEW